MLIQVILTIALVACGAYAQFQRRTSAIVSRLSQIACVAGLLLVWNPDASNVLAHLAGVGRGADLVFYIFIAVSLFISLYLHLRVEASVGMITDLARALALQAPLRPEAAGDVDARPSEDAHGTADAAP